MDIINKEFLNDLEIGNMKYLERYLFSSYKERIPGYYDNSFKMVCKNRKYLSVILEGVLGIERGVILEYLRYHDTVLSSNEEEWDWGYSGYG